LQGLGILYAYDSNGVDEAVARGRLRPVLSDWSLTSQGSSSITRIVATLRLRFALSSIAWLTATDLHRSDRSEI
jgi:hypothetical protein